MPVNPARIPDSFLSTPLMANVVAFEALCAVQMRGPQKDDVIKYLEQRGHKRARIIGALRDLEAAGWTAELDGRVVVTAKVTEAKDA